MTTATKATHTPAPWVASPPLGRVTGWSVGSVRNSQTAICDVIPQPTRGEAEANARLIAAAPALLESLCECLAIVRLQNSNLHDDINEIQSRADAAIAAARGETT